MSRFILLALVAGLALAQACKDDSGIGPGEPVARVEVSPPAPTVGVGGSIQLTATLRDRRDRVLSGRTVIWSTQPTVVLTVSPTGLVTAHIVGSALVTATSEGKERSVTVTAIAPAAPVASVSLDRAALDLLEGDEARLVATARDADGHLLEGRNVQWTSSDPAVVAVTSSGDVAAIRVGTAEIVATVEGKTARAAVEVTHLYRFSLLYSAWDDAAQAVRLLEMRLGTDADHLLRSDVLPGWHLSQVKQSPNREHIVFTGRRDGSSSIFVINGDLSGLPQELWEGEEPSWSPDGSRIALVRWSWETESAYDIWVVNLDEKQAVNLTGHLGWASQYAPAWSPDGGRIAFAQGDAHRTIWTMRPDGTDPIQVTTGPTVIDDYPAWSPDGTRLVFARSEGQEGGDDLWLVNANGGMPVRLLDLPGAQTTPAWSPDGRLIAFSSGHEDPGAWKIYTVWTDGTKLARRTGGAGWHGHPAWRRY